MYQSFVQHLQPTEDDNGSVLHTELNTNLEYVDYKLRLRVNYIHSNDISQLVLDEFKSWQKDDDPPSAIIVSLTYSDFKNGNLTEDILKQYSYNLTKLVKPFNDLIAKKSKILWKLQDPINEDDDTINDWKNVKNSDIDKYNQKAKDILTMSNVRIWSSSNLIAAGLLDELENGWILSKLALRHDIQILLNMYCNDYMNYNDGSCCSSAESYTILQIVTYAVFGVL